MDVLRNLAPVSETYAALPVADAFDWSRSAGDLGAGEWYLVAFRSVRREGADETKLAMYDEFAHREAATAAGFVHYLKGPTCADGSCLSFCLWERRSDARAAAGHPSHVAAVSLLGEMYATYTLEFLRVRRAHEGAPLVFEPYDGPPSVSASTSDAPLPEPSLAGLRPALT
jgi:hypothetical protein